MESENRVRVVIDTNVLISSFLFGNTLPGIVVRFVVENCLILQSKETIAEIIEEAGREKFDRWTARASRMTAVHAFLAVTEVVPNVLRKQRCRDPRDDMFIDLAEWGTADFLISGDSDLLELATSVTQIISPENFARKFRFYVERY